MFHNLDETTGVFTDERNGVRPEIGRPLLHEAESRDKGRTIRDSLRDEFAPREMMRVGRENDDQVVLWYRDNVNSRVRMNNH